MPRTTVTVYTCSVCEAAGAERWTLLNKDHGRARVDLCPKCVKPLLKIFKAGSRPDPHRSGRSTLAARFVNLDGE